MKKKQHLVISGLIFVLLILILSGCTEVNQDDSFYINQMYEFEIIPPTGWTINENTTDPVKFFCPDQNDYPINLAVREPITSNETVSSLGELLIERYSESFFKNFTLISSSQTTINGLNAYELVYSEGQEPNMLQHKQVLFEKNKKIFSLTYTSLVDTYDTYISVVDQSINTFTVI
jgi:hypothetical protein